MKIVHFSDTHLGFNDLEAVNEKNINQREADFYDTFEQVVQEIKKIKPDYIIHTGDLFHRSSPSNRAISFSLNQFKIINELNIPFIVISGNHSTPKTSYSTPILEIFKNFENIYLSYLQNYKQFEFNDVVFHTLPHINDEKKAIEEIDKIKINKDKKNILMLHCSVGRHYLMEEFGEWVFPKDKEYVFDEMDYVGLGHWHTFTKVRENVYYSGATERTSMRDKKKKGFLEIELKENLEVKFKEVNLRPIITREIEDLEFEDEDVDGAIVEVTLKNLTPLKSMEITNKEIKEKFKNAINVVIKREFKYIEREFQNIESLSLKESFIEYLKDNNVNNEVLNKVGELFYDID